jgi:hypothetical protein
MTDNPLETIQQERSQRDDLPSKDSTPREQGGESRVFSPPTVQTRQVSRFTVSKVSDSTRQDNSGKVLSNITPLRLSRDLALRTMTFQKYLVLDKLYNYI